MSLHVLSGVLFFPRGGSAQVARAQAEGLRAQGCTVTLVAGSRSGLGGHGDAQRFYRDVHAVDFDPALASDAPLRYEGPAGTAPMHPSYEERPDAPDAVFASLDDLEYEVQVRAWARALERAGAAGADVALLHHLTPLNEALARVAPKVPVVGQLHGTELLMLERIVAGAPASWRHAERWAQRMRAWAQRCELLLVSPTGQDRAASLLGVARERFVTLASGVDVELFSPAPVDRAQVWTRALVDDPQGWLPGQEPGSVRYGAEAVAALAGGVVLLSVGRFTAVKRLDLLLEAFAAARHQAQAPAGLVLVGGHPGECEGEHPAAIVARTGAAGVFLAGWHAHDELPDFFRAADAIVTTSEREQFGLVLVEAMACGLPVVATRSPGPELIVRDGQTGWLVDPGDRAALVRALVAAIDDGAERRRRGEVARTTAGERFSWTSVTATLARILSDVAAGPRRAPAAQA